MWFVPSIWEGAACFILGGGISSPRTFGVPEDLITKVCNRELPVEEYSPYYKPIHDRHTIGVNNSYQLGDWVDFTFFGDCSWWTAHRTALRSYNGILVSCCARFGNADTSQKYKVRHVQKKKGKKHGITKHRRQVVWNGNSGAAAINLAVHFGAKNIFLLGFDMKPNEIKDGAGSRECNHWHGAHFEKFPNDAPARNKRPPFGKHLRGFPAIQAEAKTLGATIYNLNPDSAITCLPVITLEKALSL